MPLMLAERNWPPAWLAAEAELLALLKPCPEEALKIWWQCQSERPPAHRAAKCLSGAHAISTAERADWQKVAKIVLPIDLEREPDRAERVWESYLDRARWLTQNGFAVVRLIEFLSLAGGQQARRRRNSTCPATLKFDA